ncbi:MAG: DNA/RNA non-specific endonuclease [Thermonemataceae bacterium]
MQVKKYLLYTLTSLLAGCLPELDIPPTNSRTADLMPETIHLDLGNPTNATVNASQSQNYLIVREQYALSYNREKGTANWVAWYLDRAWIGDVARQDDFRADTALPGVWYRVDDDDYVNSGFNRGHLCPSGDRTNTPVDNSATFLMTNIIPQAPDNNQGPWRDFEEYTRDLVTGENDNEVYVYSGVYGRGGEGSDGTKETIAEGNVVVPTNLWKVVIVLPQGEDDLNRIDENTRIIAIDIPNEQGIRSADWQDYRVSVDAIEANAEVDFLADLSETLQETLESRVDTQ